MFLKKSRFIFMIVLTTASFLMITVPAALSSSYYIYDDFGGTWHDVNKNWVGDSNMCWAAAASNILDWGSWHTPFYPAHQEIFDNFKYHWTNEGGMMDYGWDWWLNGTNPPDWTGWSQVDGGGNHWPEYEFSDYYNEEWERDLAMSTIDEYLHSGYGTTLAIYSGLSGHALTCWGYEYDDKKGYTDIWVTDSDDDVIELVKCSVSWNKGKNWWTLGDAYNGYHIGGVEGLAATPEPVSSILFVIGGASLVFFRYRRRKRICKK